MYTINVTYTGFDYIDTTDTLYFHMSSKDWLKADEEMKAKGHKDGYAGFIDANFNPDNPEINPVGVLTVIEDVVRRSYGTRDGNRFVRTLEQTEEFMDSLAYDAFLDKMIYDPDVSAKFISSVLPKSADMDKLKEQMNAQGAAPQV